MTDYPFTTDGCSGGMSWLWRKTHGKPPPWEGHCIEHDRTYHAGGTRAERAAADRKLMEAVAKDGHTVWAGLIWIGVRLGGHPFAPTPWRWGYGWKYPHGYREDGAQ